MAYIVQSDLETRVGTARLGQLTAETGSTPDATAVAEIMASAEGEVNGYLARRHAVPVDLSAHPDLAATLKGYCLDIAAYRAFSRRPPVAEDVSKARGNAIEWLKAVSEGKIVLPAAATPASTNADDPKPTWGSNAQNAAKLREL